ncbi:CubicO group peptidase, beta-lactamase class C family [Mucilaginibacter lappiensis]|uniref:CubicO group peptidase (Beta-lactamase class C family) n=1 Tax=Mucilaginibacter lappiensis TaxID=354630 RepID=A0ABR6PG70_9SPHI|nr:serine hydrolase [Mucilaginibacter lappiensis]MBB6108598.1 CubicO group peptidase (beta-lactamase class C family) [Mucilaginibacter lappiensis]SIQ31399.1 CubicO group peptidase, beta-lactamase class C family [Mucilaginibacter lappiensis]
MKKIKIIGSILFLLIAHQAAFPQQKVNLGKYFSALHKNQHFNGNVLVAENGKVIFKRSYGYADFDTKRLNTFATQVPIASITKTLTATAIFQLKDKGSLKLTDPVIKFLPDFPYPEITIKNLLSHTSGMPSFDVLMDSLIKAHPDTVLTNKDFLTAIKGTKIPLNHKPGEKWNYDNTNFVVLALIVEKLSGLAIDEYFRSQILKPACMTHTFFPAFTFYHYTNREKQNLAIPYFTPYSYSGQRIRSDSIPFLADYWHKYNFRGFGETISTVEDLLKYDQVLYNGKLVNAATLKEAFIPYRLNSGAYNIAWYGLGWQVDRDSTFGKVVNHTGGVAGLSSVLVRNITKHQTIIVYTVGSDNAHIYAIDAMNILNGRNTAYPKINTANLYAATLLKSGTKIAAKVLRLAKRDTSNYAINEDDFNAVGYDLLGGEPVYRLKPPHHYQQALEIFKLNTSLFPSSWNVYDSYGDALRQTGHFAEAIKMYRKSIELNPKNDDGKEILKKLLKN